MLINARYGPFYIPNGHDLIAQSLRLYGEWAQLEIDVLANFIQEGDVVADIGSFIGSHARAFSEVAGERGKVYAFEANSSIFPILEKNAELARLGNIAAFGIGLGATDREMYVIKEDGANQGANRLDIWARANSQRVGVKPIDSLDIPVINFLKIDVEGMELEVLMGADEVISRCMPIIFAEANSLESSHGILGWARLKNYFSYGLIGDAFNHRNFNREKKNIFGPAKECGLLLIPQPFIDRFTACIESLRLPEIKTIDDLALLLLHKPQYTYEVLERSAAALKLGIKYSSPAERKPWPYKLRGYFDSLKD